VNPDPPRVLASEDQLEAAAGLVIGALAGPDARVRDDQLAAARVLAVEGRRALVVQATGWGKSAVYWIAARALRDAGAGPVLIVSPLLALMRDQVAAAGRAGLRAVTVNSSNIDDWSVIETDVLAGRVDVVLVSPERLANPAFVARVLEPMLPVLGLLVIDEAHCIRPGGTTSAPTTSASPGLLANPGCRCWRPRPRPTTGSPPMSPGSSATASSCSAVRWAGPRCTCRWCPG
jgi:ATP-dependent DNA helicase RecQ